MADDQQGRPRSQDKLDMIRQLRADELERLSRTMQAFPKRDLPTAPVTEYERAVVMDEVFERIEGGESIQLICMEPHMPSRATVMTWLARDIELQRRYESLSPSRARSLFELALWEVQRACDVESMKIAERRAILYLRAAALLDPKSYSDKTHTQLGKQTGNAPLHITLNIGDKPAPSRELVVVPTPDDTHE
jgi:hypothetical protein